MTVSITAIRLTGAADRAELPLLVLGPSREAPGLDLWLAHVGSLTGRFDVLALDLPGQGYNSAPAGPSTAEDLLAGLLEVVDDVQLQRGDAGAPFAYVAVADTVGAELMVGLAERASPVAVPSPAAVADVFDAPSTPAPAAISDRERALVRLSVLATRGSVAASDLATAEAAGLSPAEVRAVVDLAREI